MGWHDSLDSVIRLAQTSRLTKIKDTHKISFWNADLEIRLIFLKKLPTEAPKKHIMEKSV